MSCFKSKAMQSTFYYFINVPLKCVLTFKVPKTDFVNTKINKLNATFDCDANDTV